MRLDRRPFVSPASSRYRLVRTQDCVYAIPSSLDAEELLESGRLCSHPGVYSATTKGDVEVLLAELDKRPATPAIIGRCGDYELHHYRDWYYAIPQGVGYIDLDKPEDRRRVSVWLQGTNQLPALQSLEVKDVAPCLLATESQARSAEGLRRNVGRLLGHDDLDLCLRG